MEARRHLQAALLRLGVAISALTLVAAQLRNAEVAYIDKGATGAAADAIFPNAYVLLYGWYFTCLLAMMHLPVAQSLLSEGQQIQNHLTELKAQNDSMISDWFQARKNASDTLQLETDSLGQLKTAVSILAPLVGSIVGVSAGK